MGRERRSYTYTSYEDDLVETADQGYRLPADYEWVRGGRARAAAFGALYGAGLVCARAFLWAHLRWRVEGRRALRGRGGVGCVLYCNHTQPVGDALAPALAALPSRVYVVASPANLGIPHLGKLLPGLGALPVPSTPSGMKGLLAAVARRLAEGAVVVVYPEAHVWPYYTGVRPFPATSFAFAADNRVPAFCMTTTYRRRRRGERPQAVAYIDGPFWPSEGVPRRAAREGLRDQVLAAMRDRARLSTYAYARYEQKA